jgi:hypothetical protein
MAGTDPDRPKRGLSQCKIIARDEMQEHAMQTWQLFLLTALQLAPVQPCSSDVALKKRLLTEAPVAWAAFDAFGRDLEGSFRVEQTRTDMPANKRSYYEEFTLHGKMGKMSLFEGLRESVYGMNGEYFFSLERAIGDLEYSVKVVEPNRQDMKEKKDAATSAIHQVLNDIFAPWYFNLQPLNAVIADPAFVLKTVEPLPRDGKNLVRVTFEWKVPDGGDAHQALTDCFLILDPAEHWCIQEYEFGVFWGGRVHARLEYGPKIGEFPSLRRKTMRTSTPKMQETEGVFRTLTFERLTQRAGPPPENAFKLSGHGLPEPEFKPPGRDP